MWQLSTGAMITLCIFITLRERRCFLVSQLVQMQYPLCNGPRNQMTWNSWLSHPGRFNFGVQLMRVKSCTKMVHSVPNSSRLVLTVLVLMKMVSAIQEEPMVASTFGTKSKNLVSFWKLMPERWLLLHVVKEPSFQLEKTIWFRFSKAKVVSISTLDKFHWVLIISPLQWTFWMARFSSVTTTVKSKL